MFGFVVVLYVLLDVLLYFYFFYNFFLVVFFLFLLVGLGILFLVFFLFLMFFLVVGMDLLGIKFLGVLWLIFEKLCMLVVYFLGKWCIGLFIFNIWVWRCYRNWCVFLSVDENFVVGSINDVSVSFVLGFEFDFVF